APEAFYGRAWSDLELKHTEAAVAGFRELLSAFPDHALAPSAALQAARALADLKRTTEALALLADIPRKYSTSPLVADAQSWSGSSGLATGRRRGSASRQTSSRIR